MKPGLYEEGLPGRESKEKAGGQKSEKERRNKYFWSGDIKHYYSDLYFAGPIDKIECQKHYYKLLEYLRRAPTMSPLFLWGHQLMNFCFEKL